MSIVNLDCNKSSSTDESEHAASARVKVGKCSCLDIVIANEP